jgi:hypothetical protein
MGLQVLWLSGVEEKLETKLAHGYVPVDDLHHRGTCIYETEKRLFHPGRFQLGIDRLSVSAFNRSLLRTYRALFDSTNTRL